MEVLLRLAAAIQSLVRILTGPIFWLANLRPTPPCPPIKEPLVLLSATQIAAKIRTGQVHFPRYYQNILYCLKCIL